MKIKITKEKIFYIAFSFYFIYMFIKTTMIKNSVVIKITNIMYYLSIVLIILKISLETYNKKKVIVILISAVLAVLSAITSKYVDIFMLLLLSVGAYNVKFKNIVKIYFYLRN